MTDISGLLETFLYLKDINKSRSVMTAIRVHFADTVMLVRAVTDFLQLVAKVVDLGCVPRCI